MAYLVLFPAAWVNNRFERGLIPFIIFPSLFFSVIGTTLPLLFLFSVSLMLWRDISLELVLLLSLSHGTYPDMLPANNCCHWSYFSESTSSFSKYKRAPVENLHLSYRTPQLLVFVNEWELVRSCRHRRQTAAKQVVNPSLKGALLITLAMKWINNENRLCVAPTQSADSAFERGKHHYRHHVNIRSKQQTWNICPFGLFSLLLTPNSCLFFLSPGQWNAAFSLPLWGGFYVSVSGAEKQAPPFLSIPPDPLPWGRICGPDLQVPRGEMGLDQVYLKQVSNEMMYYSDCVTWGNVIYTPLPWDTWLRCLFFQDLRWYPQSSHAALSLHHFNNVFSV